MSEIIVKSAKEEDLDQIINLQQTNLKRNVNLEKRKKDGYVTLETSEDVLQDMIKNELVIGAYENDKLVAYLICLEKARLDVNLDALTELQKISKQIKINGKQLNDTKYCALESICIDKEYRSKGILPKLYEYASKQLGPKYDYAIGFIDQKNPRSYHSHVEKLGFLTIGTFDDSINKATWNIVAKPLRAIG
ncbi:GNAT family N-acetyltransferase [Aureibacter tunicatorum]|uniref:Ribosomal protein S18 acetylase RimI-like enzyme n=1 Tax=Aureibacter tunicatorum TaxID=866807 RepID=A0AAE4BQS2_9BACT|nr:GNAT family N-acetyltransferase [Aureibacter tunicatorum]MDR6237881.1 ribosomal protein S18 acetylase RimI-like enzyme [Aureibacter tunicatorum]BDD02916.1 hypothetical protein AUTU_03990 [Aureibacter tunicatorum]